MALHGVPQLQAVSQAMTERAQLVPRARVAQLQALLEPWRIALPGLVFTFT